MNWILILYAAIAGFLIGCVLNVYESREIALEWEVQAKLERELGQHYKLLWQATQAELEAVEGGLLPPPDLKEVEKCCAI